VIEIASNKSKKLTRPEVLYPSAAFGTQDCHQDFNQCPLLKIKKINGMNAGVESIPPPVRPSQGDVAFVKKYYPWKS
jgi:hypothetical protein